MITYSVRMKDHTVQEVSGIPAPVPGLAVVPSECTAPTCAATHAVLLHVGSEHALLLFGTAEVLGPDVWAELAGCDWEREVSTQAHYTALHRVLHMTGAIVP